MTPLKGSPPLLLLGSGRAEAEAAWQRGALTELRGGMVEVAVLARPKLASTGSPGCI